MLPIRNVSSTTLSTALLTAALLSLVACQSSQSNVSSNATATATAPATEFKRPILLITQATPHQEHDHQTIDPNAGEVERAYIKGMNKMHEDMMVGMQANDPDVAFAKGMLPHHEGAIDMAEVQLKYGKDETMRQLAQDIIKAQQGEIEQMQRWLAAHPDTQVQAITQEMQRAYDQSMQDMHDDMMQGIKADDPDMAFAKGMLPHHEGAVAMAEVQLQYGKDKEMRQLAKDIIEAQEIEIKLMREWIVAHS